MLTRTRDRENRERLGEFSKKSRGSPIRSILKMGATMLGWGIGLKVFRGMSFKANLGLGKILASTVRKGSLTNAFVSKVSEVAKAGIRAGKYTPGQISTMKKGRGWYRKLQTTVKTSLDTMATRHLSLHDAIKTEGLAKRQYFVKSSLEKTTNRLGGMHQRYAQAKINANIPELLDDLSLKDIRFTSIVRNTKKFSGSGLGRKINEMRSTKLLEPGGDLYARARKNSGATLGGPNFGKAMAARMYRYGTDFMSYAPLFYASHRLTAVDDKKWYQPSAIADWTKWAVGTDIVFRGAMPAASIGLRKLGRGAANILENTISPTMAQKGAKFLESISKSAPIRAADLARDYTKAEIGKVGVKDVPRYTKTFFQQYRRFRGMITKDPNLHLRKGTDHLEEAMSMLSKINTRIKGSMPKHEALAQFKKETIEPPSRAMSFFNKMIRGGGLSSASRTIKPTDVGNAFNKQVTVNAGRGMISLQGQEFDVSNILPKRLMQEAGRMLGKVSIAGVRPGTWFGLKGAFRKRRPFAQLLEKDQHLGIGIGDHDGFSGSAILQKFGEQGDRLELENQIKYASVGGKGQVATLIDKGDKTSEGWAKTNTKKLYQSMIAARKEELTPTGMEKYKAALARGHNIQREGESFFLMGDKSYYSVSSGVGTKKAPVVFQTGYDVNAGQFHRWDLYAKGQGGTLSDVAMDHFGRAGTVEVDGKPIYGSSGPRLHSRMHPDKSPIANMAAKFLDKFEVGSKEERAVLGKITDLGLGRYIDSANTKVFLSDEFLFHPEFAKTTLAQDDGSAAKLIRRLDAQSHRMEKVQAQRVLKGERLITAIRGDMQGNAAGKKIESTIINRLTDDFSVVKQKAKARMTFNKANKIQLRPEMEEIIEEIASGNATSFRKLQSSVHPKLRMNKLDAYNNSAYRTWFKSEDFGVLDREMASLMDRGIITRNDKAFRALEATRIISEFDNFDVHNELINAELGKLGDYNHNTINRVIGRFQTDKASVLDIDRSIEPLWSPWGRNSRVKSSGGDFPRSGLLMSKNKDEHGDIMMSIKEELFPNSNAMEGQIQPITMKGAQSLMITNAINNVGNIVGMGFNKNTASSTKSFMQATLFKRILPAAAIASAWQTADMVADESNLFEGTSLGEGLNVFVGEQIAKTRLSIARINDITGVTDSAKYLEDLMPGAVNSGFSGALRGFGIPMLGSALGMAKGGPKGGMIGGAIGGLVSLFTAGGPLATIQQFDITKSRRELLEQYAGRAEVPIYKGQGWLFGGGSVGGIRLDRYQPNWFHRLSSQYRHSDVLYGDKFERMRASLDPFHYYEKHKYSRPYPVKEIAGVNMPLVGNVIGLGGQMASEEDLKYGNLASSVDSNTSYQSIPFGGQPSIYSNERPWGGSMMNGIGLPAGSAQPDAPRAIKPTSFPARVNAAFRMSTEFAGLRGFMTQEMITNANGGMYPYEQNPILASASSMTSPSRMFWEQEWGDMLAMSEMIRRFVPKKGQHTNEWNQMPNIMPKWMPGDDGFINFQAGDPYCVSADTPINTSTGYTLAADICEGDKIYTHNGSWLPVKKKVRRKIRKEEKSYSLKVSGVCGVDLEFSEEHPLLVKRTSKCTFSNSSICRPLRNLIKPLPDLKGFCDKVNSKKYKKGSAGTPKRGCSNSWENSEASFVPIKDCKPGDYLVYKIPASGNDESTIVSYKQLVNRYRSQYVDVDRVLHLDGGMCWVIGLYLAEGSTAKGKNVPHRLIFSMSDDEVEVLKHVKMLLLQEFSDVLREESCHIKIRDKSAELVITSYILAQIFNNLAPGNLYQKRIPQVLFDTDNDCRLALLFGMILGDGYISSKGTRIGYSTANGDLAHDFRRLAFSLGIPASYEARERVDGRTGRRNNAYECNFHSINVYGMNLADLHYKSEFVSWGYSRLPHVDNFSDGEYIYQRIAQIDEIELEYVYGFEVDDDDSFCVMDFATHNTKITRGEARLPGAGYTSMKDVAFNFPFEAEYLGFSQNDAIGMLTGQKLPTSPDDRYDKILSGKMAQRIAQNMSATNINIKTNEQVFHPEMNLSGKADLVVNGNIMKIKAVSNRTFSNLTSPNPQHTSELNALLNISQSNVGSLMYVNAETGDTTSFNVSSDPNRFKRDVETLESAKAVSEHLMTKYGPSIGVDMGQAYSRIDRLRILGDVAPYSKQFKDTLKQVKTLAQVDRLSPRELQILDETLARVDEKRDRFIFTEKRFNRGNPVTSEERQYQEGIKLQYSPLERAVGSGWEAFTHLKSPLHTKFLNTYDPIEQYERNEVYGKPIRMWGQPYQDFVRPYATSMTNIDRPIQGALSFGTGGLIFGGPIGGAIGAGIGTIWGASNGVREVPGYKQKERRLIDTLDKVQYEKARRAYELDGDTEQLKKMKNTMTWAYSNATTANQLIAATPRPERAFMERFMRAGTEEERERIMSVVPDYVKPVLSNAWMGGSVDKIKGTKLERMPTPGEDWSGWKNEFRTEDIAVKMFNRAGLDAHDVGLGWQSQIRKMSATPNIPESFTEAVAGVPETQYEQVIRRVIPGATVSASTSGAGGVSVNLRVEVINEAAMAKNTGVRNALS